MESKIDLKNTVETWLPHKPGTQWVTYLAVMGAWRPQLGCLAELPLQLLYFLLEFFTLMLSLSSLLL